MRKLKLQIQISVDGFVGGTNGELDWMTWNWDDELKDYVGKLTDSIDTILLGRKMTDGFVKHWSKVAENPSNSEYASAKKFVEIPKIVFSRTLKKSEWENTTLAVGDTVELINNLKQGEGKDIIVYGGADFVSSLISSNLIDEYHLFINPAAIGKGLQIFNRLNKHLALKLMGSKSFDCGIIQNIYEPDK